MSRGGGEGVENVTDWERVPILRQGAEPPQEGQYGKHLPRKRQDWRANAIGPQIYLFGMVIPRDIGGDSDGRRLNIRGDEEEGCGPST